MKLYRNLEEFLPLSNAVVTTGTFDGVHIGHQTVLNQLKSVAEKNNGESVVLTFFPHPRMVLYPDETNIKLINSNKIFKMPYLVVEKTIKRMSDQ